MGDWAQYDAVVLPAPKFGKLLSLVCVGNTTLSQLWGCHKYAWAKARIAVDIEARSHNQLLVFYKVKNYEKWVLEKKITCLIFS